MAVAKDQIRQIINCKGDLKSDNKRNGHSPKTLKSQYGEFQIDVPRARNGEFEHRFLKTLLFTALFSCPSSSGICPEHGLRK